MPSIGQYLRLGRRDDDDNPLLTAIREGGLGTLAGAGGIQEGFQARPDEDLPHITGAENHPQGSGSLADDRPESSVLLGTGMRAGGLGGQQQFKRSVVNRGGKLMEAHSYGPGTETKFFERKNPAVLQAAMEQAMSRWPRAAGAPAAPASQAAGGLNARDAELLKMLLGNPTLRR